MSKLSESNLKFIIQFVNSSKITSIEMKEDLIDHFCCAVEEIMEKGLGFEKSFNIAFQNICPDGLDEIQQETVYLLTSKKIKVMRKFLYLSAYFTAMCIMTTIALKMTHTPGGSIALLASFFLLVFLFLPSFFINLYKREISKTLTSRLIYLFAFTGLLLFISAGLFKIMHWPFASFILFTSIAILNFALFPLLFYKMYRKA